MYQRKCISSARLKNVVIVNKTKNRHNGSYRSRNTLGTGTPLKSTAIA